MNKRKGYGMLGTEERVVCLYVYSEENMKIIQRDIIYIEKVCAILKSE